MLICVLLCTYSNGQNNTRMYIHPRAYIHTYMYIYTCTHTLIHIHVHTHMHIHVHTHTHTRAHAHTHTHTHTHVRTHKYSLNDSRSAWTRSEPPQQQRQQQQQQQRGSAQRPPEATHPCRAVAPHVGTWPMHGRCVCVCVWSYWSRSLWLMCVSECVSVCVCGVCDLVCTGWCVCMCVSVCVCVWVCVCDYEWIKVEDASKLMIAWLPTHWVLYIIISFMFCLHRPRWNGRLRQRRTCSPQEETGIMKRAETRTGVFKLFL